MDLKRASLLATGVLVLAVVSMLVRRTLFATTPVLIAIQVAAGALMIWARATFGIRSFHASAEPTRGPLVTTGPYRFIRHPIYTAILLFVWTGVASRATLLSVLTAIVATAAITVRIGTEEALVTEAHPEYREYARHTKRVIPFVF